MRYFYPSSTNPVINIKRPFKEWSFARLLFLVGTPLVGLVMFMVIVSTYRIASHYLGRAYARNAHTRTLAQAHEIEQLLIEARYEVLNLGQSDLSVQAIQTYMMGKPLNKRNCYAEIAFHGVDPEQNFLLVNTGEQIWRVPADQVAKIKFNTFARKEKIEGKVENFVQIDEPTQVYYTSVPYLGSVENMEFSVIRLSTPIMDQNKVFLGYLTLSLDIREVQQIMTLYLSRQSPLYIFPQEKERMTGFFFDTAGWLICESGLVSTGQAHVSVDNIRTGLQGDVGRPGFSSAFRPNPQYEKYWTVISDVQAGRNGELQFPYFRNIFESVNGDYYLYYVPIRFQEEAERSPVIIGGIGCIDGSFMYKSARYEIATALAISWLVAILLTLGAFFFLNRRITKPVTMLTQAVEGIVNQNTSKSLEISPLPRELFFLQRAINIILLQLQAARNETRIRQSRVHEERDRQPVRLEEIIIQNDVAPTQDDEALANIVGSSGAIQNLRTMIKKAASVMADVLVIGETGTGKELTAEAIHRASPQARGPFISVNCGALDENLLLDVLFGHVKGAFSDAKTDRRGAFVSASGGTLLLDEIGNASPKVQQALLRALAVRTIRPLGSDTDIPFDARVIAATNVDLLECSKAGTFREDLYFRLAVITIATPPLRQRKEDIPALVHYFINNQARAIGRQSMKLSRGALDKLLKYEWPGNVREVQNCITRALAFADGEVLLAEHFDLGKEGEPHNPLEPEITGEHFVPMAARTLTKKPVDEAIPKAKEITDALLNARQQRAWPHILAAGGTNRATYQEIVEESISVRTAQYDLQDLVKKGLLLKKGRGPASRYVLAQ